MSQWSDVLWIPVDDDRLPQREHGKTYADGQKVVVRVLTVGMVINGEEAEPRGFHLGAGVFEDDDDGLNRVMFWAPCTGTEDLSFFPLDDHQGSELRDC